MSGADLLERKKELVGEGMATVEEGQSYLRLSRSMIYALMDKGLLAYVKIGRSRRIPRRALIELAAGGVIGG
jgi:excisionase family DNA binding protein